MKTNIGRVMASIALTLIAFPVAAQTIVPLNGNGAVVAPGAAASTIDLQVRGVVGNPLAGVTVTFEQHCTYRMRGNTPPYACVSHPSPAPTAVTDATGRVSTPAYIADAVAGNAWVLATANVEGRPVTVPIYWTIGTSPRSPVQVVSGNNQVLQFAMAAAPLVARVQDDFGLPMAGVPVEWVDGCATTAGAPCLQPAVNPPLPVTDAIGQVSSGVRVANNSAGAYFIRLVVRGTPPGSSQVDFNVTNVSPARTAISRTKTGAEAFLRIVDGPGTCSITRMQPLDQNLVPPVPTMLAVPEGPIEVTFEGCPVGAKLALSLQHPGGFPEGARIWTVIPSWQPFASTNTIEGFWEFSLTDGAAGDHDNLANGSIQVVLAVGFGTPAAPNFQDLWWAGNEENGWGMSIVQHRDQLFAVIFAYDAAGQPTWYVMSGGSWNAARDTYTGALYSPRGRPLNEHVSANLVMGAPVGTLSLTFSDVMNLRVAMAFGTNTLNPTIKFLKRQLFGPRDARQVARMDDMWWAGVQRSGWGLAIHQQYASLFSVLFTYGTDGKPIWYPMPSGMWTANNVWEGHVYKTVSSTWPVPYDPALFVASTVGSFKLDFANGAATFDFSAEGRASQFPITRMGF